MCNYKDATPKVEPPMGLVILLINIIWPGVGTILAACSDKENEHYGKIICAGITQMLLSFIIVGWFMAVYHGYLIWKKSEGK